MTLLVLLASILILAVTVYQYDEQTQDYNIKRFERKEATTIETIDLELTNKTTYPVKTEFLAKIFQWRIYEISSINKLNISIFDLHGNLLVSSITNAFEPSQIKPLPYDILNDLAQNSNHKILIPLVKDGMGYQTSYSYIHDPKFKRIGILELQFTQDNSEIEQTRLNKRNEKIVLNAASTEIETLVEAYNNMIDQLEESAVKLAKSEREQAWREMAKQVAHEIKNPLTPMRLSVQSFERKFNPEDKNIREKLTEYSKTLIQQIDVMSSIASAFSDFAKMPTQKREKIEVISIVKLALDIFNEDFITYTTKETELFANLDKTQLIRIVTNLVKNALQASEKEENPIIDVKVSLEKNNIKIRVSDNGKGIPEDVKKLIFEPKFTTKSSGMGLGLPMIKNIIEAYDGTISFTSQQGIGTVFTVILPRQ
jgi:signal transduction histidine kinase